MIPAHWHFLAESFQRHFQNYEVPTDVHGLIVSPGGVASTSIMEHVGRFVKINDTGDRDGLKHRPKPSSKLAPDVPVLLIVGDSSRITISLERRGYLPHQAIRLGCWTYFSVPSRFRAARLASAIARQRRLWSRRPHATLVLEFDKLWERPDEIAALFGIRDRAFHTDFPQREPRFTSDS